MIDRVIEGKLLTKPNYCPPEVYELMLKCWKFQPNERASMNDLYIELIRMEREHLEKLTRN